MSTTVRSAFLVLFVLVIFIISLPLALSRITRSDKSAGCRALADTGEIDPRETLAIWQNRTINPLLTLRETLTGEEKRVLGVTTAEKWIEIDLSDQKLIAHQGDTVFLTSPISSGLWHKTPA